MKKIAMICQPIAKLTDEQISVDRERAIAKLTELGYEVRNVKYDDPYYSEACMDERGVVHRPLCFLARNIQQMCNCHAVYFVRGWDRSRGCVIEHSIADAYGTKIIYDEE